MAGQWLPPLAGIENGATREVFKQMAQGIPPLPASVCSIERREG